MQVPVPYCHCALANMTWKWLFFPRVHKENMTRWIQTTLKAQSHLSTSAGAERSFFGDASQITAAPVAILILNQRNHHMLGLYSLYNTYTVSVICAQINICNESKASPKTAIISSWYDLFYLDSFFKYIYIYNFNNDTELLNVFICNWVDIEKQILKYV